ncbi:hypothetical protein D0396_06350 [Staphylococcus epidermidis]|nr:hypothetical protein [Staphylococcus epidermidis]MBM0847387.1 hypothetical protein [Staphylococcus epidermidis]
MVYFVVLNRLECRGVFELKKLAMICAFTVLILAGCGLGDSDNKGSSTINDDQQSGDKNNRDSKSSTSRNQTGGNQQDTQQDTHSNKYYAQVWLTALDSYRGDSDLPFDDLEIVHQNISNKVLDPYHPDESAKLPEGTELLTASVTAAGSVYYKNNGDGTITIYNVPSHFQGSWRDADYSKKESQRIIDDARTVKLYNASESEINKISQMMRTQFSVGDNLKDEDDTSESENQSSSSDEVTVTRSNVIDIVEDYEGHQLDTDTYIYKEPEKDSDGSWGFSFTDKEGHLEGSYIIDKDGEVTKYDEDGEPE